jgi:regulator of sigma E protease
VGTQVALTWIEPGGTERQASVKLSMPNSEPLLLPLEDVRTTIHAGPIAALGLGARRTIVVSKQVFLTLRGLIRRDVSAKNLAGPVGIVHQFTLVLAHGEIAHLLYWLAVISVNLGLLNLLPFPILDGGHLLFLAIEKIKGSPVDVRIQEWAINVAFFLILFLAVFVTFNDVKRLFQ